MKKLIIAAAIVCAAAVSQAASIGWTTNNKSLTDAEGNLLRSATALENIVLVNLGSTADFSSVTASQIIPTSTDTSVSPRTTMNINTATTSKGGRITGTVTFTYNGNEFDVIKNGDYLALMFYDGKDFAQLKYSSDNSDVSATYKVSGLANNASTVAGAAIGMTGNFYGAVPEPTSALLLVLGMAGLALKRKRA